VGLVQHLVVVVGVLLQHGHELLELVEGECIVERQELEQERWRLGEPADKKM
jgi:hypothetical protein